MDQLTRSGLLALAFTLCATAQNHPDFSGTWLLNSAESKKGGFEVDLTIGGEGYESDAAGVVSAEWKGSSLVITTLYNPTSDHPSDQTETWVLSEGGNKVVDELEYHKQGKALITRVFDRQR